MKVAGCRLLNVTSEAGTRSDSSTAEEMRAMRGTLTEAGQESAYRSRSVDENLDLFRRMKAGQFPDGAHVLRAMIGGKCT